MPAQSVMKMPRMSNIRMMNSTLSGLSLPLTEMTEKIRIKKREVSAMAIAPSIRLVTRSVSCRKVVEQERTTSAV